MCTDKLAAAQSFARLRNFDTAEELYVQVLTQYDCTNREARRGLEGLNPTKLNELLARCKQ